MRSTENTADLAGLPDWPRALQENPAPPHGEKKRQKNPVALDKEMTRQENPNLVKSAYERIIQKETAYDEVYRYLQQYQNMPASPQRSVSSPLAPHPDVRQNRTIWAYWHQGIANAPLLVKKCVRSVCQNKPAEYDMIVLDQSNIRQYVWFAPFIWDKLGRGAISKTHFSDLLRIELLYLYGGCWVDATVFCSGAIVPYMLDADLFFFQWSMLGESVLKGSSWWIAAQKGSRTIRRARDYLYRYWEQEDVLRHYYLLHIILSRVIDEDSCCMAEFKSMPYVCNAGPHVLYANMEFAYSASKWRAVKAHSDVHKLSYKRRFLRGDIYNFYSAFMDGKLS